MATVIEKIVRIPYEYHETKTKSWNTLLQESGYFDIYSQIQENDIVEILKKDTTLITQWMQWSDDSRSSSTWYFTKSDDNKYFVGHWPEGKEFKEMYTKDEFTACAYFIKCEIESTRQLLGNK